MIELLTANTPNGKKISIMLEEIEFEYKVTKVNIQKDEQFDPKFRLLVLLVKFQLLSTMIIKHHYLSLEQYSCI